MDSSWFRRLHPQGKLLASEKTISRQVITTGDVRETDSVGRRTVESRHFEGKTNNGRIEAKVESFLETEKVEAHCNDPQQAREIELPVDLRTENSANASSTHRIDLTDAHATVKDETKMESKGMIIKPLVSRKTLILCPQNKTGVPLKPISGRILFNGMVGDAVEQTVDSHSESILLDAPSAAEILISDEERNKINCNSTLAVMVGNNIHSDDLSMRVHESMTEDSGERCINECHGVKSVNSSFHFTCADLQLKLSPPPFHCSVAKAANMDLNKDAIKLGNSHTSRLDDTSSLSWSDFAEVAGPSEKTRDMHDQVIRNERISQVANTSFDRRMENCLKFAPRITANVLYASSKVNQDSQDGFRVETRSKMPEIIQSPRVSDSPKYSAARLIHCIEHTEGNCQSIPFAREQCGPHATVPADKFNLASSHVDDTISVVEHNDWSTSEDTHFHQTHCGQISNALSQIQSECEGQVFSNNSAIHKWKLKEKVQRKPASSGVSQVTGFDEPSNHMQSSLGKRPSVIFETNSAKIRARATGMSHMWIQRWHPNTSYNTKNIHEEKRHSASEYSTTSGPKEFKDIDYCNTVDGKGNVIVDQSIESSKTVASKRLPSAAAMAIVGTAVRQFSSTQPQQKGFAFWSGFGMTGIQKFSAGKSKPN